MVAVAEVEVAVAPGRTRADLPFPRVKRLAALVTVIVALPAFSVGAAEAEAGFPEYSGVEFQALYEYAIANTLPNLESPQGLYEITGNDDLDARIWELAFERGYALQPAAGSGELARVGGVPMQPQAAEAWAGLREVARDAGMGFVVSSAYRSPASQKTQFLSKLSGSSDSAIDATLTWYSVPGTSKHHAGYALDFRYANGTFGEFRRTPDHAWLAEDNFAVPKQHGLIPSYPDDVENQGPNPEPWEYVWVGRGLIMCGMPQELGVGVDGPAAAIAEEVARCPGGAAQASLPDWLAQGLSR